MQSRSISSCKLIPVASQRFVTLLQDFALPEQDCKRIVLLKVKPFEVFLDFWYRVLCAILFQHCLELLAFFLQIDGGIVRHDRTVC
jgi:hypothetical protein